MNPKDLEKAIKKDENQVRTYLMRSKIAQSGYMEHVNEMIMANRTYQEVMNFLAKKGITVTPAQISKHKKMLPYIVENEPTPHEQSEIGLMENTRDRLIKYQEMTNVELAIETLQQVVKSSQIQAVNELWGEIIPQMIASVKLQVKERGDRLPFKDIIDSLDKVVKIARLLEDKATVIQASTVNGETQITHKHEHTIESIGDGTAESVSSAALEAMAKVNEALETYANQKQLN